MGLPAWVRAVPAHFKGWWRRRARRLADKACGDFPVAGGRESTGSADYLYLLISRLPSELREMALTHSSWTDSRTKSYERLEFLGDSVLGLAIAATLYEQFPHYAEGELARLKAFVVSRASCSSVASRMGLAALLEQRAAQMGVSTRALADSRTILGNVLEALIGAVFLTYGFEITRQAVARAFAGQIEYAKAFRTDYKTTLQEYLAARGTRPVYRCVAEEGPPHARLFTSEVEIDGQVVGRGTATTIKMSEQIAAREALSLLGVLKNEG